HDFCVSFHRTYGRFCISLSKYFKTVGHKTAWHMFKAFASGFATQCKRLKFAQHVPNVVEPKPVRTKGSKLLAHPALLVHTEFTYEKTTTIACSSSQTLYNSRVCSSSRLISPMGRGISIFPTKLAKAFFDDWDRALSTTTR